MSARAGWSRSLRRHACRRLGGNPDPETITFAVIQQLVDRIVTVSEDDLSAAVVGLVEAEHLVAEGAGAAATAALVGKRVDGRTAGLLPFSPAGTSIAHAWPRFLLDRRA